MGFLQMDRPGARCKGGMVAGNAGGRMAGLAGLRVMQEGPGAGQGPLVSIWCLQQLAVWPRCHWGQ